MKLEKGSIVICKKYYQSTMKKKVKFIVGKQYKIDEISGVDSANMYVYIIRANRFGADVFHSDEYFKGFPKSVPTPLTPSGRITLKEYPGLKFSEYFDVDLKSIRKEKLKRIDKNLK